MTLEEFKDHNYGKPGTMIHDARIEKGLTQLAQKVGTTNRIFLR